MCEIHQLLIASLIAHSFLVRIPGEGLERFEGWMMNIIILSKHLVVIIKIQDVSSNVTKVIRLDFSKAVFSNAQCVLIRIPGVGWGMFEGWGVFYLSIGPTFLCAVLEHASTSSQDLADIETLHLISTVLNTNVSHCNLPSVYMSSVHWKSLSCLHVNHVHCTV